MVRMPKKPRLFEEHKIPTEDGNHIYVKLMFPKAPITAKRLVLMPPLIGASASQTLIIFRNFTRRGAILVSFEYRGHLHSTGTFELDSTLIDTDCVTRWASNYARERGLPMHGFTTCFGLVSLLASQFKKGQANKAVSGEVDLPSPFWSISAVSGLFNLDQIIRFDDFAPLFGRNLGRDLNRESFLRGIEDGIFDWEGDAFRDALVEFLQGLFQGINIGRDVFAELPYDRVKIPETLSQLLQANYLDDIDVPPEIPCNFFFGYHDDILALGTPEGRETYFKFVKALIPHAVTHVGNIDHNGIGPDHDLIIEHLCDLFEEAEAKAVPLGLQGPHMNAKKFATEDTQHEINQ